MSSGDPPKPFEADSKRLSQTGESLYQILHLEKDCSEEEIKRAYRKLALQHHPDKNPSDANASDKFKEVNRAHAVLMDANKRAIYDEYGSLGLDVLSRVGEERAALLLRLGNPCLKAVMVVLCVLTGCCYCCLCYCFYCCGFCCGRCAPDDAGEGDEDGVDGSQQQLVAAPSEHADSDAELPLSSQSRRSPVTSVSSVPIDSST